MPATSRQARQLRPSFTRGAKVYLTQRCGGNFAIIFPSIFRMFIQNHASNLSDPPGQRLSNRPFSWKKLFTIQPQNHVSRNRSADPRLHSTPFDRLKSSKTGCPGAMSAQAFAKSPQPTRHASGPCRNFRPHHAPKISPDHCRPGKPLALRLPAAHQATASVSPDRQKSDHRGPMY
jgi:hypothetical protein